jgi:CBS domain-containing protein
MKKTCMQLRDVMSRHVEVVAPDTPLREAARKMIAHSIAMLPVCEGRKIVGLLSARDITVRATAQGRDPRRGRVRDVMMAPAIYGCEDQYVDEAADVMQRWRLYRLPVLDRQMRVVGIISLRDLHENITATDSEWSGSGSKGRKRRVRERPSDS